MTVTASGASGLAAEATFELLSSTRLKITLSNTSTGLPAGFDEADQLLSSVSFDLGAGIDITGGSVVIAMGSASVNFDKVTSQLSGGDDVTSEWGFGNKGYKIGLENDFVTSMRSQATSFPTSTPNLDGPSNLNGPGGGLTSGLLPLSGLGGIDNSVDISVDLSGPVADLGFLRNGVTFEFGSDAAFLSTSVPEPGTLALLGFGLVAVGALRRRFRKLA